MNYRIKEPIKVLTLFDRNPTTATPVKISWHNKTYDILKIGFHHKEKRGRTLFHIFSVTTDSLFFRIVLDTEHLEWEVEEISDGTTN